MQRHGTAGGSGVVKSVFVVTRRAGVSHETLLEYWLGAPSRVATRIPGSRRCVLSYRVADDLGNAPYDGFATLWFDDEEEARAATTGEREAAMFADGDALLERSGVKHFLAREIVMRDLPTTPEMVKLVFFFHRKPGMSPQEFRHYWLEVHGPLAMQNIAGMRRYIQNHTLDSCYANGEPAFDGLVEAWLENLEALHETEASDEHRFVRSDEQNFLDLSRVTFLPVREQLVYEEAMAEIAGAIGVAHNPFFPLLLARGGPAADEIEHLYSGLRKELERMRPNTLIVFTTDHYNLFFDVCVPIFCIGVAESASGPSDFRQLPRVDVTIDAQLAKELQTHVVQRDFDVAMSQEFELDHTITAPLGLILPAIDIPIIPVFVSTSMRPIPSASRCRALGAALREAVERSELPRRVALVASGGFSFDVGGPLIAEDSHVGVPDPDWVDRAADRLRRAQIDELVAEITPQQLERAGNASGEILNWITMLGMIDPVPPAFLEVQREEGNVFAAWRANGRST